MRWVDFQNKKPTDSFPGWTPWSAEKWQCWLDESKRLLDEMTHLTQEAENLRSAGKETEAEELDGSVRDGCWWLAFDYSNFRAVGNAPNRKKGGWFPLHKDSRCSRFCARCEESETYFLLDPVRQTDVDLLAFADEGNAIPRPNGE